MTGPRPGQGPPSPGLSVVISCAVGPGFEADQVHAVCRRQAQILKSLIAAAASAGTTYRATQALFGVEAVAQRLVIVINLTIIAVEFSF